MSDDNVLDYLREQFASIHDRLKSAQRTQIEHGHRLTAIEIGISRLRRDMRAAAAINNGKTGGRPRKDPAAPVDAP